MRCSRLAVVALSLVTLATVWHFWAALDGHAAVAHSPGAAGLFHALVERPVVEDLVPQVAAGAHPKIFTLWEYPDGPDPFIQLNVETWKAHAPAGAQIMLVNDSNIRRIVPDTPDEYFRLPYPGAKADAIKAGVLYHHGGLYMDADFVVMGSLDGVFAKLQDGWDVVTYSDESGQSGSCFNESHASNFIAARRGNAFSRTWWQNIKRKLSRVCGAGEFALEKVCCHEAFAAEPEKRECHIPWGHLEWLKHPHKDADAGGPPRQNQARPGQGSAPADMDPKEAAAVHAKVDRGNVRALRIPGAVRTFCFRGEEGMAPHSSGEVYWQPWDPVLKLTNPSLSGRQFDTSFSCQSDDDGRGDLKCSDSWGGNRVVMGRFFHRVAHHLFFTTRREQASSMQEVLQASWLISALYRQSLLGRSTPNFAEPKAVADNGPAEASPGAADGGAGDAAADVSAKALEAERQAAQEALQEAQPAKYKIFTFWDYPNGPDPYVVLNVETWKANAPPGTEVVLVNDSNIRSLVPDLVEEWYRLPYPACKSDFVRSSVLHHHGGLYMDADFLVLESLGPVFAKLDEGWDVVTYSDGAGTSGECQRSSQFSSNFLAVRKGNPFSSTWWENMKLKLTRICGEGEFDVEKVCCHEAFAAEPEKRACHIPWGHLEWLKQPHKESDARGRPKLDPTRFKGKEYRDSGPSRTGPEAKEVLEAVERGNREAKQLPPETKLWCLRGQDGFTPHTNGEVYWQGWDHALQKTDRSKSDESQYDVRFDCREAGDGDLDCKTGNWGPRPKKIHKFFGRIAYHLFFSTRRVVKQTREEIFEAQWILSELYRRALKNMAAKSQAVPALAAGDTAAGAAPSGRPAARSPPGTYKIWTFWDYNPHSVDPLVLLNLESWKKHAPPGTEVVLVNKSNIRQLVPDCPEEFFRLPYPACKSDFVRASVLAHHGGLYMDADFMVNRPLDGIFAKLDEGWDIVAYSDGDGVTGECDKGGQFSSNFLAARKGDPFTQTWWENMKHKLTRMCGELEMDVEKVCCHEAFDPSSEKKPCHIPWGHLEWLKQPVHDSDAKGPPSVDRTNHNRRSGSNSLRTGAKADEIRAAVARGNEPSKQLPGSVKLWCLRGPDSMAPHLNGEVFWQPWDASAKATDPSPTSGKRFDERFTCHEEAGGDLTCSRGNWGQERRVHKNFFGRPAYHLFFSTRREHTTSRQDVFDGGWLLSEMYRRSLSAPEPPPAPAALEQDGASKSLEEPPGDFIQEHLEEHLEGPPAVPPGKYNIFTYWNYPNGADAFVALNLETWRRHAPAGTEVVMVNESNFRDYVPDAPPEFWRLPYDACKSDVVRAAVLYHQGGLYMDTDFVATGSLERVMARLDAGEDIVAYSDSDVSAAGASGPCDLASGGFSSNFMAARQHNPFSRTWWANIRHKLTRMCGEGEYDMEKVCCHEAFSPEMEHKPCHIPWAHLEWLKAPLKHDPDSWGAPKPDPTKHQKRKRSAEDEELSARMRASNESGVLAAVALGNQPSAQVPQGTRVFCMRGAEGMAIPNGEVFWQPWDPDASATRAPAPQTGLYFDTRFACRTEQEDLVCTSGNWGQYHKVFPSFFRRTAYHLFFSTKRPDVRDRRAILSGGWLLSELYRRSLGE